MINIVFIFLKMHINMFYLILINL